MAGKVKSICEEKVSPVIEELGYEVVEVEYAKKTDGMNLTFYIDKEEGIQVEDCEKVSKAIDGLLEELNPTDDQPYILNVSSPGIDRPLKTERDFKRNMDKEIEITLFSKIDGKKRFVGNLKGFDAQSVTIENNGKQTTFDKSKIAHIVPVLKF
ncbi:MAG: ribosome maturation factor RimP [Clostridia bacterium]|nr:ribosome maturation factor RimP [Clostridia bacterium]